MRGKSSLLDVFQGRGRDRSWLGHNAFPTRKNEDWHYTPLHALDKTVWQEAAVLEDGQVEARIAPLTLPLAQGKAVFANGHFVPSCSVLPEGRIAKSAFFSRGKGETGSFSFLLNEALEQKGLELHVPAGQNAGTLILLSVHEGEAVSTHVRHQISLGEGASLTLLDVNIGRGRYLANPVFDIDCAKGAHLTHVKHQDESHGAHHLAYVSVSVDEAGTYESFTVQQGGLVARHEVRVNLRGEGAVAHVNAVQIVTGQSHHDLTSLIHHAVPHCQSRQTVRTVPDEQGTGVFQGKILVDQIAQKTDGYQMNQALLLSDSAQMNSKPELEIYADNVRCSHGATVGALDEEQLFYLRSRGIPGRQARQMLIRAFLEESLDLLEDQALRDYLMRSLSFHD